MPIEQLLFALTPIEGYQLLKSVGVNSLLTDESIQFLRTRTLDKGVYILPVEMVVAVQHIEKTVDELGREGVWNHTLLIPIREYLQATNPLGRFARYLLKYSESMPKELEQLSVNGDGG